jgi:hypothetical protein
LLTRRKMKPEDRVNLAVSMSSVVAEICADGIRDSHPGIREKELIRLVRSRLFWRRRRYGGESKTGRL